MMDVMPVPLHEAARERYLAYALSVVTSRALPDIRDGLKPVHRRILFNVSRTFTQPHGSISVCGCRR